MTNHSVAEARPAGLVGRGFQIVGLLEWVPMSLFQLLMRLVLWGIFFDSGRTKLLSWQATIALFRDEYKVPLLPTELAAVMGTTIELSCSTLLLLGLATRLATLPLLGLTFVIEFFVYPGYPEHQLWGLTLLFLLSRGPGVISLDHLIWPRLFRRS